MLVVIAVLILLIEASIGGLIGHHLDGQGGAVTGAVLGLLLGALLWCLVRRLQSLSWQSVPLEGEDQPEASK